MIRILINDGDDDKCDEVAHYNGDNGDDDNDNDDHGSCS